MQPRVHFRVSNLCILRRLTAFCGQTPQGLFATGGPERRTSPCVAKPVGSGIRNWHGTSGSRFNDSTGDGSLPPEWAQDRVSQGPRGPPCNNLPSLVGKSRGQCRDCYRAATSTNKARNKAGSAVRTQKDLKIRVKHLHSAGRLTAQNSSARSAFCGLRFASHAHFAL